MMAIGPLGFLSPWILVGLAALPVIWWLLQFIPPRPNRVVFPPTRLLKNLKSDDQTAKTSPWWLTALRLFLAMLIVLALARPVLNPDQEAFSGSGPIVLAIDDGWASANHWRERTRLLESIIARAERQKKPLQIVTSATETPVPQLLSPDQSRELTASLAPAPFVPNREQLATRLTAALAAHEGATVFWLSDGLDYGKSDAMASALKRLEGKIDRFIQFRPRIADGTLGLFANKGDDGVLQAHILRAEGGLQQGRVQALSARGEQIAEIEFTLAGDASKTSVPFNIPLEIRNQIARLKIENHRSAGAVHLLDARSKWRRVGVLSGEAREAAQPLLSPLYYVERALVPFAEIVSSKDRNLILALQSILKRDVSVVVLADIGKLVGSTLEELEKWVEQGGTLVRFAGPRLEQGGDDLLPQPLRRGGRALGGALSWSSPKSLAPFEQDSPFYGLQASGDTLVRRQVLTDPSHKTTSKIWARLGDGTPLVSANRRGKGQVVLFHITADSEWSNLPLSGLFVEMLNRIVQNSSPSMPSSKAASANTASQNTWTKDGLLAPQQLLNGYGELGPAGPDAVPLEVSSKAEAVAGFEHAPGYYGPSGATRALNLLNSKSALTRLADFGGSKPSSTYGDRQEINLQAWLITAALVLFLIDATIVLALSTRVLQFNPMRSGKSATLGLCLAISLAFSIHTARAGETKNDDSFALRAALKTRLAYVITGDGEIDRVSQAGLAGLSKVLAARTAVEPSEPMGVDVKHDDLTFFPLLYWPVRAEAKSLDDATLAKVDAYMKQGGIILFDTRDYHLSASSLDASGQSPGTKALARLVGKLDVPPLAPVPDAHVLTKAFYLMRGFPGRWNGGTLWAEALEGTRAGNARRSDGVSSILITSNDFAAAWALDSRNQPLFPAVPGGEMLREMAFRSGVNIVMYALTGNYKADQVHVPALLERLGQ